MKEALFFSFLAIFVITACVTLLGITKRVDIDRRYLNALFSALLLELVASVLAVYRGADFFSSAFQGYVKPNQQEYDWHEPNVVFAYPRVGWSIDTKRSEGGLGDLALVANDDIGSQIQMHYSALDAKHV